VRGASSANDAAKQEIGHIDATPIISAWSSLAFGESHTPEYQAESNNCGGIVASKTAADVQSNQDLKLAVERHLDWRCRIPSSFISVFDDSEHAINWAINARN